MPPPVYGCHTPTDSCTGSQALLLRTPYNRYLRLAPFPLPSVRVGCRSDGSAAVVLRQRLSLAAGKERRVWLSLETNKQTQNNDNNKKDNRMHTFKEKKKPNWALAPQPRNASGRCRSWAAGLRRPSPVRAWARTSLAARGAARLGRGGQGRAGGPRCGCEQSVCGVGRALGRLYTSSLKGFGSTPWSGGDRTAERGFFENGAIPPSGFLAGRKACVEFCPRKQKARCNRGFPSFFGVAWGLGVPLAVLQRV